MKQEEQKNLPHFMEKVGHSLLEVIAGILWGIGLTFLLFKIY